MPNYDILTLIILHINWFLIISQIPNYLQNNIKK